MRFNNETSDQSQINDFFDIHCSLPLDLEEECPILAHERFESGLQLSTLGEAFVLEVEGDF